ncbi:hypothetical protein VTH06DRAFT_8205 [Thermothelomyces fergusii]
MDVDASDHPMESDGVAAQAALSRSSLLPEHAISDSNVWQSPPPIPLPDPAVEIVDQIMEGIERGFEETLLSEATTPTAGNERAPDVPATPCTVPENLASSQVDGPTALHTEVSTPRVDAHSFGGPVRSGSSEERNMSGYYLPLTPELTPIRKRSASPPSTPRPERRRRVEAQPFDENVEEQFSIDIGLRELARTPAVASGSEGQFGSDLAGNSQATRPRYIIDIEYFSEDELEEYLAALLKAYRAFYLEPDGAEPPRAEGDPDRAQRSRRILKNIFDQQLGSAENEEFLLREEEEDILDAFMEWAREWPGVYDGACRESFETWSECLERLESWMSTPAAKNIHLSVRAPDGSLFTAHLNARDPDGIVDWKLDEIRDMFTEMGHFD